MRKCPKSKCNWWNAIKLKCDLQISGVDEEEGAMTSYGCNLDPELENRFMKKEKKESDE